MRSIASFRCSVCEQEKDTSERYIASRLHCTLCKSCASIGRYCPTCKQYKLLSEFGKDLSRANGVNPYCRPCKRIRDNREHTPARNRARKLKARFQLTPMEYDTMLKVQGGVCAICHKPETGRDNTGKRVRPLAIDHNHETGAIRGLLCGFCNYLLGCVKDDPDILQSASEYLRKHSS